MVGRGLGRGIGTVRPVRGAFCKVTLLPKTAEYFVGTYMMEQVNAFDPLP